MKMKVAPVLVAFFLLAAVLPAADAQLVGLLMPDARVVAGINVEQAWNSPFGRFLLSRVETGGHDFQPFIDATGFDPRHDLREVLMATRGEPGHSGLVLARGNFDSARIFAAARAQGGVTEMYNGVELLTGKDESQTHALAFLAGSVALAGDMASVRAAIDRRSQASSLDPWLAEKIEQLSAAEDAWTASLAPVAGLEKQPNLNGLMNSDLLKSIQQASGGVKLGAIIQLSGEAVARSDKDATALVDVVKFLAGMVQLNAPADHTAEFLSLLQSLVVTADGNTVKVGLAIPEAQLEKMLRSAEPRKTHSPRARI